MKKTSEAAILEALENGYRLTSYLANRIGHTVDSRKIISKLRSGGHRISDEWQTAKDGRRFKVYFLIK